MVAKKTFFVRADYIFGISNISFDVLFSKLCHLEKIGFIDYLKVKIKHELKLNIIYQIDQLKLKPIYFIIYFTFDPGNRSASCSMLKSDWSIVFVRFNSWDFWNPDWMICEIEILVVDGEIVVEGWGVEKRLIGDSTWEETCVEVKNGVEVSIATNSSLLELNSDVCWCTNLLDGFVELNPMSRRGWIGDRVSWTGDWEWREISDFVETIG